jgi:hypothetical protein
LRRRQRASTDADFNALNRSVETVGWAVPPGRLGFTAARKE